MGGKIITLWGDFQLGARLLTFGGILLTFGGMIIINIKLCEFIIHMFMFLFAKRYVIATCDML